ncbi:MAG: DUF721 domain-containing protein [Deltaproteobacteria bacterium]|nr:DUF721 domain-containing protein [Deltaproteobacteria bacterium]
MSFDSLKNILTQIKAKYPSFKKRVEESEAVLKWEQIVGPQIAKHSKARNVSRNILFVEVDHSIWKSELHHRKHQILTLLNENTPNNIKDIMFVDKRTY